MLDGVAGGFFGVLAAGGGGPPDAPVGQLVNLPSGVLLDPVIMTALRIAITDTRPAARLERGVVLEVGLRSRPPAGGTGTRGVPDLGQVPEHHPGVVAGGLTPVVTRVGADRLDGDDQVPLPGDSGG